jgi:hypothetical protein
VIVWSGKLQKNGFLVIDGETASAGTVRGSLPGVPVAIEVTPSDLGVTEAPGPGNGWRKVVLRSPANRHIVVSVRWRVTGR